MTAPTDAPPPLHPLQSRSTRRACQCASRRSMDGVQRSLPLPSHCSCSVGTLAWELERLNRQKQSLLHEALHAFAAANARFARDAHGAWSQMQAGLEIERAERELQSEAEMGGHCADAEKREVPTFGELEAVGAVGGGGGAFDAACTHELSWSGAQSPPFAASVSRQ